VRPYIDGPVPLSAVFTRYGHKRTTMAAKLDLTGATLAAALAGWRKPPGEPGSAELVVEVVPNHPSAIKSFAVKAGTLDAAGRGQFGPDGWELSALQFDHLVLGQTALRDTTVAFAGAMPEIVIGGGQVDATPLLEAENPVGEAAQHKPRHKLPFELRAAG